ncbi:SAM-dependent methyltransferase [uncultured Jannaschia sp.]|uniref:class I SAM-dependent methyltransferase n=1 Tax=uncultured Jannaschia sp. TaxID=293347 RepID=UPI0026130961|nr:SAM-dependent methyltransferase [uncultured Jannaschia sp.]
MTLAEQLAARIRATGPMTLAEFMAEALLHPTLGYYTTRDPLGAAGDFTTAPEISQMFGEMLGLCLAQTWLDQGAPDAVTLAELGPGRGTLMADILRATRGVPGFHDAISLHLVEASPAFRAAQATRLSDYDPSWHDGVDGLPEDPLLLVANEFLDALPIRQFARVGDGWAETLVTVTDGGLAFARGEPVPVPELDHHDVADGTIVERCPALVPVVGAVAARVATGGTAIFVDYGHWRAQGDTVQAVRAHAPVDPLDAPGTADLTAHVDFEAIARAAAPAAVTPMIRQGVLLERLGITARAQALARSLDGAERDAHIAAHRRLVHPAEMGDLFKAIALYPPGAPPPPGFDASA